MYEVFDNHSEFKNNKATYLVNVYSKNSNNDYYNNMHSRNIELINNTNNYKTLKSNECVQLVLSFVKEKNITFIKCENIELESI